MLVLACGRLTGSPHRQVGLTGNIYPVFGFRSSVSERKVFRPKVRYQDPRRNLHASIVRLLSQEYAVVCTNALCASTASLPVISASSRASWSERFSGRRSIFRSKKFTRYYHPLWGVNSQCPVLQLACTKGSGMNIMNLLCFSEW